LRRVTVSSSRPGSGATGGAAAGLGEEPWKGSARATTLAIMAGSRVVVSLPGVALGSGREGGEGMARSGGGEKSTEEGGGVAVPSAAGAGAGAGAGSATREGAEGAVGAAAGSPERTAISAA
jgi:hypothetical protein